MGQRDYQDEKLDLYLEQNTSIEPQLLSELNKATREKFAHHHMLSGHVQGRLLSMIAQILQPNHILEIGTFTGYATLCLAEGLPPNGKITTIDVDASLEDFYLPFFEKSLFKHQITHVIADAISYLERSHEHYDLIFLDANKTKYIAYFELLVPKMKTGSVIIADNVLWKGKVMEEIAQDDKMTKALHNFNQHVAKDERVEVVLLPLRDGISLIRKK